MFHALVKEPFNLSIDEIKKLTPYQVKHVYFRDEEADKPQSMNPKELFWRVNKEWRGLSEEEVRAMWIENQRELSNGDVG